MTFMDRLIKIVEIITRKLDEVEARLQEDPLFYELTIRHKLYLEYE